MWRAIMNLIRAILSIFQKAERISPWTLEVLGDLPADLDLDAVLQGGGLSNDGAAAWLEKSAHKPGIIIRRVPGRVPERLILHQLSGAQVDLRIGNMNDAHTVAGKAISNPTGSTWGILIHDQGGQVWLRPSFDGVTYSASGVDNEGFIVGNGTGGVTWENGAADPAGIEGVAVYSLHAAAVSPSGRHLAGAYIGMDDRLQSFPWYRAGNGVHRLKYVEFEQPGTAHDINAAEISCGENIDSATNLKIAWRYNPADGKTTWLKALDVSEHVSALSLNAQGSAVGYSGNRAVYWPAYSSRNPMPALDLTAQFGDANLVLARALRINDRGDILCFGWRLAAGGVKDYKMFLAHPPASRIPNLA